MITKQQQDHLDQQNALAKKEIDGMILKVSNITPAIITHLEPNEIFVFGSNLAGRHGAGAAKAALKFGAIYGKGSNHWGQTYAIPTKNKVLQVLHLAEIEHEVSVFKRYAESRDDLTFLVTPIGCGLAGYKPSEIGPMFKNSPPNVCLPSCFLPYV